MATRLDFEGCAWRGGTSLLPRAAASQLGAGVCALEEGACPRAAPSVPLLTSPPLRGSQGVPVDAPRRAPPSRSTPSTDLQARRSHPWETQSHLGLHPGSRPEACLVPGPRTLSGLRVPLATWVQKPAIQGPVALCPLRSVAATACPPPALCSHPHHRTPRADSREPSGPTNYLPHPNHLTPATVTPTNLCIPIIKRSSDHITHILKNNPQLPLRRQPAQSLPRTFSTDAAPVRGRAWGPPLLARTH